MPDSALAIRFLGRLIWSFGVPVSLCLPLVPFLARWLLRQARPAIRRGGAVTWHVSRW